MIRRFARDQRGTATVEFALIGLVLFALLAGVIELALIMFAQSSLENAARIASRYGITNQVGPSGDRAAELLEKAREQLPGIIDPNKVTLTMLQYSDFSKIGQPEPFDDDCNPPEAVTCNSKYDPGETYKDINGNGQWDADQGTPGPGPNGALVVYELSYKWDQVFSITELFHLTPINLSARIIVRNEP
jgi:Flp pilus assembly pilin Flp